MVSQRPANVKAWRICFGQYSCIVYHKNKTDARWVGQLAARDAGYKCKQYDIQVRKAPHLDAYAAYNPKGTPIDEECIRRV